MARILGEAGQYTSGEALKRRRQFALTGFLGIGCLGVIFGGILGRRLPLGKLNTIEAIAADMALAIGSKGQGYRAPGTGVRGCVGCQPPACKMSGDFGGLIGGQPLKAAINRYTPVVVDPEIKNHIKWPQKGPWRWSKGFKLGAGAGFEPATFRL